MQAITEQLELDFDALARAAEGFMLAGSLDDLNLSYEAWSKALCAAVPPGIGERPSLIRLGQALYNRAAASLGLPNRRGFM